MFSTHRARLPAHDREVTVVTHLAEKAKAEFHFVIQVGVDSAKTLVRGVNQQYSGHGVNHPVLKARFLKRWIRRAKVMRVQSPSEPAGLEQKEFRQLSQYIRHARLVVFAPLRFAAKISWMIHQISDAFILGCLFAAG